MPRDLPSFIQLKIYTHLDQDTHHTVRFIVDPRHVIIYSFVFSPPQRSGRIPGIYGRLGDLGVIDDKYDVAITTASGALNHIVVDTVATGQKYEAGVH